MVAVVLSGEGRAQSEPFARGIDLVPLKLSPSLNSGLILDGAELESSNAFILQGLLDFNVGILSLRLGNERVGDLLPFRADLHLLGAYQVHPRIELAADLPITVYQVDDFVRLEALGFPQASPSAFGLGAPRIQGRFQLLRQSELPIVGLAGILELRLPLGAQSSFLSDRGLVIAPRLAIERGLGPVRLLANVGYRFRTAPGQYWNLFVGHEFTLGGGAIAALPELGRLRQNQALLELNVATAAEAPFTFRDADSLKTPFELMLGVRTVLAEHWRLQLAVGKGLGANGYGRETIRFALSIAYQRLPVPDRDGDGIPDATDGCADEPEDQDGFQDEDGCPEPDSDQDRDGDEVPDSVDVCPVVRGPPELLGCPDRDGDQIPDVADKCPDQAGTPAHEGCPPPAEEEPVVLESERIRINNQIQFEFGSAKIDPRSYKLLDDVVQVLKSHPDVGPVLIEGHTDDIGARAFNLQLSRRRAKSVEDYLTTRGIQRSRLRSAGFGFDRPLVPNDSFLNRARNRRTEFKLVEASTPATTP